MAGALEGLRVLDLSRFQSGPVCGMLLGEMGAEVIRIEEPGGAPDRHWGLLGPDGETLSYKIVGRNRKGITLRINTPQGKDVLKALVRKSDVILHNFTPGAPMVDELSYDRLKDINPRVIVAGISGFGQNGPDSKLVCFDHIAQARSGGMMLTGFPGDPPLKTTITHNDISTGLLAMIGILLALLQRGKSEIGQDIDVSLFDTAFFSTQCMGALLLYEVFGEIRKQVGNLGFHSYLGCFRAKDDKWILFSGTTNAIWKRLSKAIGREDMAEDPRFGENDMVRFDNAKLIDPILKAWVAERTAEEAVEILQKARVPCGLVKTVDEVAKDPQVKAREMIVYAEYPGLGRIPLPGIPIKLSESPGNADSPAPEIGQHNEEIYSGLLGFSREDIDQLKKENII